MKKTIKRIPVIGEFATQVYRLIRKRSFPGSRIYWQERYSRGGDSGAGSYGRLSEFKALVLNEFVAKNGVRSIIEFGCGDGNQLALATYPSYHGYDVSEAAIARCLARFSADQTKKFDLADAHCGERAELTLSLDVISHLIEDGVFHAYMRRLFDASTKFVIVYSSNTDENSDNEAIHVRHRNFTDWVARNVDDWRLISKVPNAYPYLGDNNSGSFADFYIFARA